MGSRDRDSKSLQDKLKVFFKKGGSAPLPARNELVVTVELERELGPDAPLHRRLRALKEVGEKVINVRVQEGGVEKLWSCTRDLLEDSNTEARQAALSFLRCIANGQADYLQIMRTIFFRYLRETHATHPAEDSLLRFKLLHTLTNSGKNINCFEEEIGPFLLEWLPMIQSPSHTVEFLQLIINVVKFNATYLDEHIVHGIVNNACQLCSYSAEGAVVAQALSLLEAVVSYSLLPRAALATFVTALCRTVNVEHHCQSSWKLMRCVVGGDIGHAALQEMVSLLVGAGAGAGGSAGEEEAEAQAGVARGAVFYMNMALWGSRRVPSLRVSLLAVLPAFLKSLERRRPVLTYEVLVAVQSVVTRAPADLHEPAWDVILRILRTVVDHDKSFDPPNELIHTRLHGVITAIEALHDAGQYYGDADALLDLVDYCGHDRPEPSAMRLVRLRVGALSPTGAEWASGALALADKYLRHDKRLAVRLHTLTLILDFIHKYRWAYGEELAESVGVPVLAACALDTDTPLRAAAARALPPLARVAPDACTDLVDLLEKILNRPFEMYVSDVTMPADMDTSDLKLAVSGLLEIFHEKLLASPGTHATRCFLVLLDHLDNHYKRPTLFMHHPDIRIKIFDMVFGLRVNSLNCVGFCYDASGAPVGGGGGARLRPVCSPFLVAEPLGVRGPGAGAGAGACVAAGGRAARAVSAALTREQDWAVLSRVLRALPLLLQTRALALGRRAADIDLLASTLCSMVSDRSLYFPECLRVPNGQKLLGSEFHAVALPALAALAPYHSYLEPQTQQRIVRCLLKYGMVLRTPQPYINALTIFTLETRETMVKMLPEVVLDLSKISDTQAIASPMLEFLSTLTRLPKVFASFVEDQYMSVFAILLPYTNPSRYNHYVVSLAHHVIAAWFLKCRLSYRRNFVRFIIHGLHNYIIMPFEEQLQYHTNNFQQANANEDSSNRQRSSSLGSRAVSRAPLGRGGGGGAGGAAGGGGAGGASASAAFHVELTETCVDLLARYTSTPCSVKPHRSDTAEFLFNGGQSMTWLVGHKLITITTSGCLQNSIKQGLCDRCAVLCKLHADSVASPLPPLSASAQLPAHAPAQVNESTSEGQANNSNTNNASSVTTNNISNAISANNTNTAVNTTNTSMNNASNNSTNSNTNNNSNNTSNHLQVQSAPQVNPPEVKRYSRPSLQHSGSAEGAGCAGGVAGGAGAPLDALHAARPSRQNSSENNKSNDPLVEVLNQFSQRFERISKEVDAEEAGWWRAGDAACPCWCARWAEVHIRSPTGDVCFVTRVQNQMNWDYMLETPLQDIAAILNPTGTITGAPPPSPAPAPAAAPPTCVAASAPAHSAAAITAAPHLAPAAAPTLGETKPDASQESEPREVRERSGSMSSQSRSSAGVTGVTSTAPPGPTAELHKSNSDSVVAGDRNSRHGPAQRMSTQPINIPGSPQRQSSSSTTDDDDMLLIVPEVTRPHQGKSRHPVRRSNSSPEMSSSWKVSARDVRETREGREGRDHDDDLTVDPLEMILLPSVEPQSASVSMHASKKASKKSDMRVSCEAIPEEMCGTSPLAAHPHLVTYKSDPGSGAECEGARAAGGVGGVSGARGGDAPADAAHAAHNQLQKTASDGSVSGSRGRPPAAPRARDELPPLARSKRSNTISVMSPTRRHRANPSQPTSNSVTNSTMSSGSNNASGSAGGGAGGAAAPGTVGGGGGGLTPSFVFLQLYHNMSTYPITPPVPGETQPLLNPLSERPLRVSGAQHERTIKNLDLVPPLETYKVGILYVGPGQQDNEVLILKNEYGSVRYSEFLTQLGTLVSLESGAEDEHHNHLFLNLEKGGKDGRYTYVWNDDIMQVLFHVATAMPSSPKDPTCNEKRKYIGNDFVSIVYNDSGAEFNIHTIKGQFNFCIVVVEPYEHGMNRVFIKTKDERIRTKFLAHLDSHCVCVSDHNVALLARQMALHCALASQISQSLNMGGGARAYASNWLERLRIIKRLRARVSAERAAAARAPAPYAAPYPAPALALRVAIDDFNEYT